MEDRRFDDLAKRLATPMSRRQAFKAILATALGGVLIRSGTDTAFADPGGNSACVHFCTALCGGDETCHDACVSTAAHCMHESGGVCSSVCYLCGPKSPVPIPDTCATLPTPGLCACPSPSGGFCANIANDLNNCGSCGHVCPASTNPCQVAACINGKCTFVNIPDNTPCDGAGHACCSGTCTDVTTTSNCGTCGHACSTGQVCTAGACVTVACPNTGPNCDFAHYCNPSNTCLCFHTPEGVNACVANAFTCSGHQACSHSSECPPGYHCVLTCCGNFCAQPCTSVAAPISRPDVAPAPGDSTVLQ